MQQSEKFHLTFGCCVYVCGSEAIRCLHVMSQSSCCHRKLEINAELFNVTFVYFNIFQSGLPNYFHVLALTYQHKNQL